ncbi:MAG: HAD family phosphatase [Bryobacteraceae bacterium]|nr:HAD family phosphatase [Bryobacteraceae bacterium]
MTYDALLFDFDGVLADSEPIHYQVWNEILAPYGVDIPWDRYVQECIGVADRAMIQRLCEEREPPIGFDELWARYPEKKALFSRRMAESEVFHASTVDLIHRLNGHWKLAVVSSSGRSEVEPPLVRAGIRERFDVLVCGLEVPRLKPAPDPYLRAAELLQARKPLVIEDSDAGVAAGRAAGFEVLRIGSPAELAAALRAALGLKLT